MRNVKQITVGKLKQNFIKARIALEARQKKRFREKLQSYVNSALKCAERRANNGHSNAIYPDNASLSLNVPAFLIKKELLKIGFKKVIVRKGQYGFRIEFSWR